MYSSQLDSFREAISNAFVKAFFLLITKLIAIWHEVYLCIMLYCKCFAMQKARLSMQIALFQIFSIKGCGIYKI